MTDSTRKDEIVEANTALGTGLGIGAFGAASAALLGAVCPICVIAAPALIGYGAYKRIRCAQRKPTEPSDEPAGSPDTTTLAEET